MRLLIAVDGSDRSDVAIEDLTRAGLPRKADAVIVAIGVLSRKSAENAGLARAVQSLRKSFPGWIIHIEAGVTMNRASLVAKAEAWQPDLIVTGALRTPIVARLFGGTFCEYILHHANRSVRVGRRSPNATNKPPRLLIGVGGAAPSLAAVTLVASRHWPRGTKAFVVGAVDAMLWQAGVGEQISYDHVRNVIVSAVNRAAETLQEAGLSVGTDVGDAIPADLILMRAREWHADCIFVGTRNLGSVGRALLGSTSSRVFATARCSVEVVHNEPDSVGG